MAGNITPTPRPYYERDGITIYHGDCADVIPALERVDLVMTDPPYGLAEAAGKNRSRGNLAPAVDYGVATWDNKPVPLALLESAIATGRYACVFGGNYYALPPSPAWLVWDKINGANDFADVEIAWTNYGTAARLIRHRWNGMLRKGKEARFHPTQKPLDVIRWAISLCPVAPSIILDPFMGSGTTLRAAKDMGCHAVGIEREEQYCEIAARRLSQEVLF